MAVINYPCDLPDFRIGKQRQQIQTYRTSQPFAGSLFIEKITDESPVTWGVTITAVGSVQARQFRAFLRQVCNGEPFNKCILTEEGFIEYEVRFAEIPLAPTQIGTGQAWEYSGVIYAVALIEEDALICDDGLLANNLSSASSIDISLNDLWPIKGTDVTCLDVIVNDFWPEA